MQQEFNQQTSTMQQEFNQQTWAFPIPSYQPFAENPIQLDPFGDLSEGQSRQTNENHVQFPQSQVSILNEEQDYLDVATVSQQISNVSLEKEIRVVEMPENCISRKPAIETSNGKVFSLGSPPRTKCTFSFSQSQRTFLGDDITTTKFQEKYNYLSGQLAQKRGYYWKCLIPGVTIRSVECDSVVADIQVKQETLNTSGVAFQLIVKKGMNKKTQQHLTKITVDYSNGERSVGKYVVISKRKNPEKIDSYFQRSMFTMEMTGKKWEMVAKDSFTAHLLHLGREDEKESKKRKRISTCMEESPCKKRRHRIDNGSAR